MGHVFWTIVLFQSSDILQYLVLFISGESRVELDLKHGIEVFSGDDENDPRSVCGHD